MKTPLLKAPTVRTWPMTLDAATAGPVEPRCPLTCAFRLTCPTWVQEGMLPLWQSGRIGSPPDCVMFARLERTHRETTGREVPATAETLLEQLAERRAIAGESAS